MKDFRIIYKPISKKTDEIERKTIISIPKPTDDIGKDAHAAVNIFVSAIGNLKKFDIIEIQELDKEGKMIGEPIKPVSDSSIVPIKK